MDQLEPYIACIAGAFALYLLLRPGRSGIKVLGTLVGLGTLAWLVAIIHETVPGEVDVVREILFLLFGAITLSAAVRMITHGRPVYSALYFVMVVLSSAGLLLLLEAEFMAFALIIVYAGAILITYMFVLMLAQQASDAEHVEDSPIYDRVSREPGAAVVVGLILAGTLVSSTLVGLKELPPPVARYGSVASARRTPGAVCQNSSKQPCLKPIPPSSGRLLQMTMAGCCFGTAVGPMYWRMSTRARPDRSTSISSICQAIHNMWAGHWSPSSRPASKWRV